MIYLQLFLSFLKIGAVSFGGGYGMISLIREEVLSHAWLTEAELLDFIAVAESTPGPIAVNIATFIGSSQGGFFGAFLATLGVVLPAFIIVLLIAAFAKNLFKREGVAASISAIRPAISAMVLATALCMLALLFLGFENVESIPRVDYFAIIIMAVLILFSVLLKKIFKKNATPIMLILISAALGMIMY